MTYRVISDGEPLEVVVMGATLPELFEHAAMAVYDATYELGRVRVERDVPLMAVGDSLEVLLQDWLGELVTMADHHDLAVTVATVDRLEPGGVQGSFGGYRSGDAPVKGSRPARVEAVGDIIEVPDGFWVRLAIFPENSDGGTPS
jgi:SHS2 domain-containing protein